MTENQDPQGGNRPTSEAQGSEPSPATPPEPQEKAAAKKASAKKATATKASAKKTAAKASAKKATAKKAAPKKAAPKKAIATKTTATKATAKKTSPKKASAKKTTVQKATAKKSTAAGREFDIVVFGATGFVGQLIAEYLAEHAPAGVRIALAGRSEAKLTAVRDAIPTAAGWPLIVADSSDEPSVQSMAARTKVVLTTVGPYYSYGLPVVEACAEHGTHYVDLTGEVLFMRRSIEKYDRLAKQNKARIVHSCGFDSIPSDLGVFALHQAALEDSDGSLGDTHFGVVSLRGGFSGGTVASMLTGLEATGADRSLARIAADPYSLSPDRSQEPSPGDTRDVSAVTYDSTLRSWVSPFVMAMVNTRVVRRSNALLGYAYSKQFRYREVIANGRGPKGILGAFALTGGMAAGFAALSFSPTRSLLAKVLPKPGDGPDEETRRTGKFAIRLVSETPDGRRYEGLVAAQGDPGYAATAMMISQCALTLVLDTDDLPDRYGVLTPATGLGQPAIERLRSAGMRIEAARA